MRMQIRVGELQNPGGHITEHCILKDLDLARDRSDPQYSKQPSNIRMV